MIRLGKGCIDCDVGERYCQRRGPIEEARQGGGRGRRSARERNVEEADERGARQRDVVKNGTNV